MIVGWSVKTPSELVKQVLCSSKAFSDFVVASFDGVSTMTTAQHRTMAMEQCILVRKLEDAKFLNRLLERFWGPGEFGDLLPFLIVQPHHPCCLPNYENIRHRG